MVATHRITSHCLRCYRRQYTLYTSLLFANDAEVAHVLGGGGLLVVAGVGLVWLQTPTLRVPMAMEWSISNRSSHNTIVL